MSSEEKNHFVLNLVYELLEIINCVACFYSGNKVHRFYQLITRVCVINGKKALTLADLGPAFHFFEEVESFEEGREKLSYSHSEFRLRLLFFTEVLSHASASCLYVLGLRGRARTQIGGHSSAAVYLVVIVVANLFGLARLAC